MNCTFKHLLSITLLVSTAALVADATTSVTPYYSARSQSQDLARATAGTVGHVYKADVFDTTTKGKTTTESWKHNFSFVFTPEYTASFRSDDIFHTLFGCYYPQSCNKLVITGSEVPNRNDKDLLADWFYLPTDYQGSICFEPTVKNFNADLSMYWGMDAWVKGMFFRIHAPITWTKWDLGAKFTTTVAGTSLQGGVTKLDNAEKFFCKKEVATQAQDMVYNPLTCARFCGCLGCDNMTKTRLADIQADWGWNFLLDKDYHLGLFARAVAPTGNRVKGEWLFEPIVGNGHHWELGGGLTGSAILWRNEEENKHFGFYVDANVTHLFNTKQNRVFDLKDKPLSRYMLANNYESDRITQAGITAPIANLTSCKMNVSVGVQADIVAMFNYTSGNWSYDLGYNFWAKSCEKFDCDSCSTCTNSCDSCDNSCSCTNDCNSCCGQCIIKNGVELWGIIDSRQTGGTAHLGTIHDFGADDDSIVFITNSNIDYNGARTKGLSNKIFGNINYNWMDREVVPFIGLGGSVEFGSTNDCCDDGCGTDCCSTNTNCCDDDCSCCKNVALSQWGIWLKGGVSF